MAVKVAILDQHRDVFLSIFKGLIGDTYALVRRILETSWTGIWMDPRVRRTVKIAVFGEPTLAHVS